MALIDGLLAYYSLAEASGAALDSHGSKDATENSTVGSTTGKIGLCRDYESSEGDYHQRTDADFSFAGDFTVSVWVNAEDLSAADATWGRGIVSYMTADKEGDWWVGVRSDGAASFGHFAADGPDADGLRYTGTGLITTGTWHHIVARHASGVFTLWVDGVSESLSTASTASGWASIGFNIGRMYVSAAYLWDGLIDELGVWSRALSDDEIGKLYNGGSALSYDRFNLPTATGGLYDVLVAYWRTEETSGPRLDSHNVLDLAVIGTVSSGTGILGTATSFDGTPGVLRRSNSLDLSLGVDTDFTLSCWINLSSKASSSIFVSHSNPDTPTLNDHYLYRLYYGGTADRFILIVGNGTAYQFVTADSLGSPATGTWYHLVGWHNAALDTINIQVNNGTVDSAAWSGGTQGLGSPPVHFRIGADGDGTLCTGLIDEIGFWKRILTTYERSRLYNSGNALSYGDFGSTILPLFNHYMAG